MDPVIEDRKVSFCRAAARTKGKSNFGIIDCNPADGFFITKGIAEDCRGL